MTRAALLWLLPAMAALAPMSVRQDYLDVRQNDLEIEIDITIHGVATATLYDWDYNENDEGDYSDEFHSTQGWVWVVSGSDVDVLNVAEECVMTFKNLHVAVPEHDDIIDGFADGTGDESGEWDIAPEPEPSALDVGRRDPHTPTGR